MKIEALFSSKQPISFTTRLEFLDGDGRSYFLPISGTSDNCLFSNYPYIQRTPLKEYTYKVSSDSPIKLEEMPINEDSEENLSHNFNKKFGSSGSKASNTTSKNIFGYSLIPNDLLSNALDNILRWLNHFVLSTPLRSFPDDVITSNGAQIFDLYCYLSGKIFQNKAKLDIPMKRV